jgi:hypothetical protein
MRGGGMRVGGFAGGGMRASGGIHGGGSVRAGGFHGAGRAPFAGGFHSGFRSGNGFHHPNRGPFFSQRHHFDGHRFGFRHAIFPYYYGWYGGPFYWDWESSSYDSRDSGYDTQYQMTSEINRLADEVQQLREDREYSQAALAPAPQPHTEAELEEDLPVVLVFLDKRIQEVKNYAVANEMLVVLDGNRKKKYPLADLDLAATMKLNDERGVDFQVPNPVMTQ